MRKRSTYLINAKSISADYWVWKSGATYKNFTHNLFCLSKPRANRHRQPPLKKQSQNVCREDDNVSNCLLSLEVLISTCNERISQVASVLADEQENVSYLVVHQIFGGFESHNTSILSAELCSRNDVKIILSHTRGLSGSRNIGLQHATGDILLVADDDIKYLSSTFETIRSVFRESDVDIASFKTQTPEGIPFRTYKQSQFLHNKRSIFHVSSIEIAIKRNCLKKMPVHFDKDFGLGSQYPSCEETIFLSDALDSGLRVVFSPHSTVIHPKESSGGNWASLGSLTARGALFRRLFGVAGLPLLIAFAFKQFRNYRQHHSLILFLDITVRSFFKYKRTQNDN